MSATVKPVVGVLESLSIMVPIAFGSTRLIRLVEGFDSSIFKFSSPSMMRSLIMVTFTS